jgi:UDP-glucose 4-epimerase
VSVMVTGAGGFIGSHLVDRLLADGEHVLGVDNLSSGRLSNLSSARSTTVGKLQFQRVDITSTALADHIARTKPELIFHLAAQVDVRRSVKDPIEDAMVNIVGTLNLLRAAADAGTRKVVFASSGGCIYGEPDGSRLPVSEDEIFGSDAVPTSPYGVSKKVVLDYFRYFRAVRALDFTALALSNVYGPRQEPATQVGLEGQVVAIFLKRMLARRPCTIYGDGSQTRDFLYVDDVVGAFLAARAHGGGELINVGSGTEVSIGELHAKLAELTSTRSEPIYSAPRTGEVGRIVVDPSKAADLLSWGPAVELDEGLRRTYAWFRAAG